MTKADLCLQPERFAGIPKASYEITSFCKSPQNRKTTPVSSPHSPRTRLPIFAQILSERLELFLHRLARFQGKFGTPRFSLLPPVSCLLPFYLLLFPSSPSAIREMQWYME